MEEPDVGREPLRCMVNERLLQTGILIRVSSFDDFEDHLRTNTIGPIITAQKLLQTNIPIGTMMFMSSDSGSMTDFRAFEDGYCSLNSYRNDY